MAMLFYIYYSDFVGPRKDLLPKAPQRLGPPLIGTTLLFACRST